MALLAWVLLNCFFLVAWRRPGLSAALSLGSDRNPDCAVAVQVHHSLDGDQLLRHPDRRFRHHQLSALDLSGPSDAPDRCRAADGPGAGAGLAHRSVPRAAAGFVARAPRHAASSSPASRSRCRRSPGSSSRASITYRRSSRSGVTTGYDWRPRAGSISTPPRRISFARRRPSLAACPASRRNIIMVLDEASFDVTAIPGIKVPPSYARPFPVVRRQDADARASRVRAVRPGTPNTMCSPGCRRAPSAG